MLKSEIHTKTVRALSNMLVGTAGNGTLTEEVSHPQECRAQAGKVGGESRSTNSVTAKASAVPSQFLKEMSQQFVTSAFRNSH